MGVNKPVGENARKGAVKNAPSSRLNWAARPRGPKRNRPSGELMDVQNPAKKKKAGKKFKGVRRER
jgi:hypothetical protein